MKDAVVVVLGFYVPLTAANGHMETSPRLQVSSGERLDKFEILTTEASVHTSNKTMQGKSAS